MGCSSCGKNKSNLVNRTIGVGRNFIKAAQSQPDKINWFKDGVSGLIKCLNHKTIYTDDIISLNREACRNCEFSTKDNDQDLNTTSQCMAPDPAQDNAPCGCFILCKTQSDVCPLNKWTHLTIDKQESE